MNFHKTIGYLAALLLMVGFGVPDSFAQTVKVSDVTPSRVTEARSSSVTVEVTLDTAPGANTTVTVSLDLPDQLPDGVGTITVTHVNEDGDSQTGFPDIEISGTDKTGTATATVLVTDDDDYIHPRDKEVAINPTASGRTPEAGKMLTVREDDTAIGPLSLSADPPSFSVNGNDETTLTVSIGEVPGSVLEDHDDNPETPEQERVLTVDVDITTEHSNGITGNGGDATLAPIATDETSTSGDLTGVTVSAAGTVTVTASADNYQSATIEISIITRDAADVAGYRVLLTAPGENAWKGIVKKAVTVEVVRADRTAYPWAEFSSIAVSLADTLVTDSDDDPMAIYTLTASEFTIKDGSLVFNRARMDGDTDVAFGKNADANEITYNKSADKLIFKFQTKALADGGGPGTILGDIPDEHDRAGEDDRSQRTAVYAIAAFEGAADQTLSSRSTTKITDVSDVNVGNGRLVRLDLKIPTVAERDAIFPSDPVVTIEGVAIGIDGTGKTGDKIRIAVERSDKLLRSGKAEILIQSILNSDIIGSAKNRPLKSWSFTVGDVIDAASDSLYATIDVEDLDFGKTQNPRDPGVGKDGEETAKNSTYVPDNLQMEAYVKIYDQANNKSGVLKSDLFRADPRAPEISVLYPTSDSPRFSGANANTIDNEVGLDFDDHLKPLKLRVDEPLDSLFVYVKGAEYIIDEEDEKIDIRVDLLDEDADRGNVVGAFERPSYFTEVFGDSTTYSTTGLKWKNAKGEEKSTGASGRTVDLVIDAYDKVGNKGTITISGVHHDEELPIPSNWFPKNSLLEESDDKINAATVLPVITLDEGVDSIAVTFSSSAGDITQVEDKITEKGETQIDIEDLADFQDGADYTMTIFLRDLSGNIYITPPDSSEDMTFDAVFDNPKANSFAITTETDSVIAGQANKLTVQAADVSDEDETISRKALTYKNKDVDDNPAFDVLVSAWDIKAGEVAEKVWFEGKGVDDDAENPDGMATVDADGWVLGKRTIHAKSNQAYDHIKVLIQHRTAGEDGTGASLFDGELDELYVGAADFAGFNVTAEQDGFEEIESGSEFTLKVVPADEHGNASVRAFNAAEDGTIDSLSILKSRVEDSGAFEYEDGFEVTFSTAPVYEDLRFDWTVGKDGLEFLLIAPEDRSLITIQTKLVKDALDTDDDRSRSIRSQTDRFKVVSPLMPALTLWPEGVEVDGKVAIPADPGEVTVTVRADGYKTDVTFTVDGVDLGTTAADEATVDVTRSEDATVTVSATDGRYPVERTIVFESVPAEQMRVRHWADAEMTVPVYLIDLTDNTVDLGDYSLFRAAWGKSAADDINGDDTADDTDAQIFLQADINGDGMVDLADYEMFLMSWGKTAVGPASKPLVLLPGVNENAEFSLSLGSERVVAGELVAVDVSLANVEALVSYGFTLNYETDKFEFISVAPADEDLLKSTGGETPLFHHIVADDGQVEVVNGMVHGSAVSGGGDIVRFVFRVLLEFEDNARFEIADGLVLDPTNLSNPAVVAGVLELQSTPREFALRQNFPNPFNPDTTIKYDLAESADVTLQIYNVLGQVVRTLVGSEAQNAGRYQIRWNGMDDRGVPVSSGVYFYQISAEGKFHDVRKLMLLK